MRETIAAGRKQPIASGRPRYIDLELTAHCNARCVMCPRGALTRPVGRMDGQVFADAVAWVRRLEAEAVILSGFGEPLLHPEALAMATELKSTLGVRVQLNTNGSLLDVKRVTGIVKAGVDIVNVSVNGTSRSEYERLMAGLRYEALLDGMDRLLVAARQMGRPKVTVQSTILKGVDTGAFVRQWQRRGVDGVNLYPLNNRAGDLDDPDLYPGAPEASLPLEKRFCYPLVFVAWDGAVYPCSHDLKGEARLGSVVDNGGDGPLDPASLKKEDYSICRGCDISGAQGLRRIGFKGRGLFRRWGRG